MAVITPPRASHTGGGRGQGGHPVRWMLAVLAVIAVVALAASLVGVLGGTSPQTTPPTTAPTTSPPPATTTPTSPPSELASAVYPTPATGIRFAHPVAAARAFAVSFVGFVDPYVGRFVATGHESGTVGVRATATGAVTTVALHRISGSWWVLGSSTPDIRLDTPPASSQIASPVRLQGQSTAFEAQVNVEVRQDGQRAPIGAGTVMGGSMGEMGPFDGSVAFSTPSATRGAIVLFTVSPQNGARWEATVERVAFAP